jgi:hypothetical protein
VVLDLVGFPWTRFSKPSLAQQVREKIIVERAIVAIIAAVVPHERSKDGTDVLRLGVVYRKQIVETRNGKTKNASGLEDPPPLPKNLTDVGVRKMLQNMAGINKIGVIGGENRQVGHIAHVVDMRRGLPVDVYEPRDIHRAASQVDQNLAVGIDGKFSAKNRFPTPRPEALQSPGHYEEIPFGL